MNSVLVHAWDPSNKVLASEMLICLFGEHHVNYDHRETSCTSCASDTNQMENRIRFDIRFENHILQRAFSPNEFNEPLQNEHGSTSWKCNVSINFIANDRIEVCKRWKIIITCDCKWDLADVKRNREKVTNPLFQPITKKNFQPSQY